MLAERKMSVETEMFEVGDVIRFRLKDGENIEATAVKETSEGVLFITKDCLLKEYPMFKTPDRMGSMELSYFNSDLRHALNSEILDRFPDEIKSRMVGMRIDNTDFFDLLRIPTEKEIFGENVYGESEGDEVEQFECMKDRRNRIAFQGADTDTWEWYWLQNRNEDYAALFADVNGLDNANDNSASTSYGVRPVFLLS